MSSRPISSATWGQKPSSGLVKARNNMPYVVVEQKLRKTA